MSVSEIFLGTNNYYDLFANSLTLRHPNYGPTGPTGPTSSNPGPQGPQGATGAQGATGSSGVIGIAAPSNAIDDNGLILSGNVLAAEYATGIRSGIISQIAQSFGGNKTFNGTVGVKALLLPTTADINTGTIQLNNTSFVHGYGTNNTFTGLNSGNYTLTGSSDCGYGHLCLNALTTGQANSVYGDSSGKVLTTGSGNCFYGNASGFSAIDTIGDILIGQNAAISLQSGQEVIAIGNNVLPSSTNVSNAIEISNGTIGNLASNEIRIGMSSTNKCFLRGIASITPPGTPQMVIIDPATHQLGSESIDNFTTQNYTMTLDSGTITTSTVRGVSTASIPLSLTKIGNAVTLVVPAFKINSQSGSASTVNFTGVGALPLAYRPTYPMSFEVSILDNAVFKNAILYVDANGFVSVQIGPAFTLPTGFSYDVGVSWIVI